VTGQAPVITIFGGARAAEGSDDYEQARRLGRLLAAQGFVLCNGGYSGTMEAVSRGAKEAGGRTIGITVDLFGATPPNDWLDEVENTTNLLLRLDRLTLRGDAFVVLRGGVGTLLELALVWNLVLLGASAPKPIVVVGEAWRQALATLRQVLPLRDSDLALLTPVPDVEAAVEVLLAWRERELRAAVDARSG
jgi:uncharacterized protein (TIGR00730 family)